MTLVHDELYGVIQRTMPTPIISGASASAMPCIAPPSNYSLINSFATARALDIRLLVIALAIA